jgi:hypothetical protein
MPESIIKEKLKLMRNSRKIILIIPSKKKEASIWHPKKSSCRLKILFPFATPLFR